MSEPWFRPYAGFSYRPTTWQGRFVIGLMVVVGIPAGIAWLLFIDTRPGLASALGTVGALAALVGHAVVLWKMDLGYGRP